jgi:hypothetical protein
MLFMVVRWPVGPNAPGAGGTRSGFSCHLRASDRRYAVAPAGAFLDRSWGWRMGVADALTHTPFSFFNDSLMGAARVAARRLALFVEFGACGPQAVKAKASKKRGPCSRSAPARTTPRFLACDGQPPLIAAWLVGCMRNPIAKEGSGNESRRLSEDHRSDRERA